MLLLPSFSFTLLSLSLLLFSSVQAAREDRQLTMSPMVSRFEDSESSLRRIEKREPEGFSVSEKKIGEK